MWWQSVSLLLAEGFQEVVILNRYLGLERFHVVRRVRKIFVERFCGRIKLGSRDSKCVWLVDQKSSLGAGQRQSELEEVGVERCNVRDEWQGLYRFLREDFVLQRNLAILPVDVRVVLAQPRHAQDDRIAAQSGDIEVDGVLMLTELDVEVTGMGDISG
jgi:hypothetical protein